MVWNDFAANRYGVMQELLQQVVTPDAVVVDLGGGQGKRISICYLSLTRFTRYFA